MLAYHGDYKLKDNIRLQLAEHQRRDEIIKGFYWHEGKGCAVGCTIHASNHMEYETQFGIPYVLAKLEDTIFEGLPNAKAKTWPWRFMDAIHPGADLSDVWVKVVVWMLDNSHYGIRQHIESYAFARDAEYLLGLLHRTTGLYMSGVKKFEFWQGLRKEFNKKVPNFSNFFMNHRNALDHALIGFYEFIKAAEICYLAVGTQSEIETRTRAHASHVLRGLGHCVSAFSESFPRITKEMSPLSRTEDWHGYYNALANKLIAFLQDTR